MNVFAIAFLLVSLIAVLACPRRWAFVPVLAAALYITVGQGVELGVFSFRVSRVLILAALLRVAVRGEHPASGPVPLDAAVAAWGTWACLSSLFHQSPETDIVTKLGTVFDACGSYYIIRCVAVSPADARRFLQVSAILLAPVAVEMLLEHVRLRNLFSVFGGVPELAIVRDGKVRATGPFLHPILAGSIGAASLPMILGLWRHRSSAWLLWLGIASSILMILASSSSGPIVAAIAGLAAIGLWHHRGLVKMLPWAAALGYLMLSVVMNPPAYYILARLDFTGSSAGWHRARLIQSGLEHLGEWWLAGTDYTRHWMPTGVPWNANHTDITNHYLKLGVIGGLPLVLTFAAGIAVALHAVRAQVGRTVRHDPRHAFCLWALGASLFTHAVNMMSISYFDQSILFFYLILGVIGSSSAIKVPLRRQRPAPAPPALALGHRA